MKERKEQYNDLMRKTKEFGRKPSFTEVRDDPTMDNPNDYAFHFRSFTDAVNEVWQAYSFHQTEEKVRAEQKNKAKIEAKKPIATMAIKHQRRPKWQPTAERVGEIRQFYLDFFIKNETMPTFIDAEKGVKMTRDELSFMRSKFLLEKQYFIKEASKITGKEYIDPWLEHNIHSIAANQRRRELERLEKENTPM